MKDNEVVMIPFVAHESAMNRMERANKRLWIVIIVLILCIFTYFLLPTEIVEDTQTVDNVNESEIHQTIGE